jgi:hypothetical protein
VPPFVLILLRSSRLEDDLVDEDDEGDEDDEDVVDDEVDDDDVDDVELVDDEFERVVTGGLDPSSVQPAPSAAIPTPTSTTTPSARQDIMSP